MLFGFVALPKLPQDCAVNFRHNRGATDTEVPSNRCKRSLVYGLTGATARICTFPDPRGSLDALAPVGSKLLAPFSGGAQIHRPMT